tara:strand:+ start:490 stop:681 length:192 start_codon:yes stop_codon:yes gene_type:complete
MPSESQQVLGLRLVHLMGRLLLSPLLLGISLPVFADLGEAKSDVTQQKVFDAWWGVSLKTLVK